MVRTLGLILSLVVSICLLVVTQLEVEEVRFVEHASLSMGVLVVAMVLGQEGVSGVLGPMVKIVCGVVWVLLGGMERMAFEVVWIVVGAMVKMVLGVVWIVVAVMVAMGLG